MNQTLINMEAKIEIKTELRSATKRDLLIAKGLLKMGQQFFVKDHETNNISGPYIIDAFTSSTKMQAFFIENRIFIPVLPFVEEVHFNLLQTDLKEAMNYGH